MPTWVWFALSWVALMAVVGPLVGRRLRRVSAHYPQPDHDRCPPS